MARRFKSKKKIHIPKIIIYIIIIVLVYLFYKWISTLSIDSVNSSFLKYLNNYYKVYSYDEEKVNTPIMSVFNIIKDDINNPQNIIINDLVYSQKKEDNFVYTSKKINQPLVYLYNTHQKEAYNMAYVEDYNVIPDVLLMSHIMQEKLNNFGIPTIVEENDISAYLKEQGLDYSKSYQASRFYLAKVLEQYDSLKLVIDLHRDATDYETSTTEIDGNKCAKIMFVVGKENDNYNYNLEVMRGINEKIQNKYPTLTRGILEKEGPGVNGIYNQDLNKSIILMELGSDKNNIDELINTIDLLIPIIKEYINEKE